MNRPRFLVEHQGQAEAFGHFREANDRVNANAEVDIAIRGAAIADAIEPILFVTREIIGGQADLKSFRIEFVGKDAFGAEFDAILAGGEVQGRFAAAQNVVETDLIYGRASGEEGEAAGKFSEQVSRVGDFAIGRHFPSSSADDAPWEFGVARGEDHCVESMREQVSEDARIVGVEFMPAEIMVGVPRDFWGFPEPAFPVEIGRARVRVGGISPFAVLGIIAAVRSLRPDERAELAGANPFRGFVEFGIGAALGTELKNFACALDRVVDLEGFAEIACEGLFAIDMFARFQRVDRDLAVPIVDGGNDHSIDIFSFE